MPKTLLPEDGQGARESEFRDTFARLAEEALAVITEERSGSLTIHFQKGRVMTSDWRITKPEGARRLRAAHSDA